MDEVTSSFTFHWVWKSKNLRFPWWLAKVTASKKQRNVWLSNPSVFSTAKPNHSKLWEWMSSEIQYKVIQSEWISPHKRTHSMSFTLPAILKRMDPPWAPCVLQWAFNWLRISLRFCPELGIQNYLPPSETDGVSGFSDLKILKYHWYSKTWEIKTGQSYETLLPGMGRDHVMKAGFQSHLRKTDQSLILGEGIGRTFIYFLILISIFISFIAVYNFNALECFLCWLGYKTLQ